ncbi:MAG TPA: YHS domain-containing protein [Candidatus Eisenbacteria bacterium]|uniref:YHS domain-containing protein n=1 Tax=Eiseniibacteriota bacterium TaxID=2212470 RepID=A0A7V2F4J9_UNCEI|nr:YHS domain-containing protein [Candidatus Eisenbacteria bacterium]
MPRRIFQAVLVVFVLCSSTLVFAGGKEKTECPVCGYLVNPKDALTHEHEGVTYYFCDAGCKAYFLQNTAEVASGKKFDAVCGMVVEREKAVSIEHNGRMAHFCSDECRDKYVGDPGRYEIDYDVVAGQVMPVRQMKHSIEFEGRTYHFASDESRAAFEKNPDAYVYEACPIGGDVFLRKDAAGKREYKGTVYYFGCKACLDMFDKDAAKYIGGKGKLECQKSCLDEDVDDGEHEGCPLKKAAGRTR